MNATRLIGPLCASSMLLCNLRSRRLLVSLPSSSLLPAPGRLLPRFHTWMRPSAVEEARKGLFSAPASVRNESDVTATPPPTPPASFCEKEKSTWSSFRCSSRILPLLKPTPTTSHAGDCSRHVTACALARLPAEASLEPALEETGVRSSSESLPYEAPEPSAERCALCDLKVYNSFLVLKFHNSSCPLEKPITNLFTYVAGCTRALMRPPPAPTPDCVFSNSVISPTSARSFVSWILMWLPVS
mmetsp:Transcript_18742/g.41738  ORF Transcript_18742/g.41738 Transcript_18742/m.41738 type:complete len:244 (+) Transcript_18742:2550-3281(+)